MGIRVLMVGTTPKETATWHDFPEIEVENCQLSTEVVGPERSLSKSMDGDLLINPNFLMLLEVKNGDDKKEDGDEG